MSIPSPIEIDRLPLLALRGESLKPGTSVRLFIGSIATQKAVLAAFESDRRVLAVMRLKADGEVLQAQDLYQIGTVTTVDSLVRLPDGHMAIQVSGRHLVRVVELVPANGYLVAAFEAVADPDSGLRGLGPPPAPILPKPEVADDIVQSTTIAGFDDLGGPTVDWERGGSVWITFEQMPPSWVPKEEYADFGRCATFDKDLQQALGVPVLWDDRERFFIEHPAADSVERLRAFLVAYRQHHEPAA